MIYRVLRAFTCGSKQLRLSLPAKLPPWLWNPLLQEDSKKTVDSVFCWREPNIWATQFQPSDNMNGWQWASAPYLKSHSLQVLAWGNEY